MEYKIWMLYIVHVQITSYSQVCSSLSLKQRTFSMQNYPLCKAVTIYKRGNSKQCTLNNSLPWIPYTLYILFQFRFLTLFILSGEEHDNHGEPFHSGETFKAFIAIHTISENEDSWKVKRYQIFFTALIHISVWNVKLV